MAANMPDEYSDRMVELTPFTEVDVTEFRPVVEHPTFNELREKSQLSFVDAYRCGGTNRRYEHAIFVYHFTDKLCSHLVRKGFLTEDEARHVRGGSLVHDLGQPPFSHAIDNLLNALNQKFYGRSKDHHIRTDELIRVHLSSTFKSLGLDPEEIIGIATKKDRKSRIISHNTLGTDKLGYLLIDSRHTGYPFEFPWYIRGLFPYYHYSPDSFGIQEEKTAEIEGIQRIIQDMYMNTYLHPAVLTRSRFYQRAVEEAIELGELKVDDIWDMPEGALTYILSQSKNPSIARQMARYKSYKNQLPKATLKIRGDDRHIILPREAMDSISKNLKIPINTTGLEREFSKDFDLEDSVYVTISADMERLIPEDVDLYEGKTKRGTLFGRYPTHFQNLLERAEDFFAVRIYSDGDEKFPGPDKVKVFVLDYFRND